MRLTKHSDYALRVLMYVACRSDRLVATEEISQAFDISAHHLGKVVHRLGKLGYLDLRRGRSGGMTLARPAEEIRLGEVVRQTEPDFFVVECMEGGIERCGLTPACALIAPMRAAIEAFLGELDRHTLADIVTPRNRTRYLKLLGVDASR